MSEEEWKKRFGERLKFSIYMAGKTVSEFAKEIKLSRQTLYRYINGEIAPSGYTIFLISAKLRLTPNYFIDVF